jgi:hypothetical protein
VGIPAQQRFNPGTKCEQAMSQVTGKGLCDSALLTRLLDEAPKVMVDVIAAYGIPVDKVEPGLRVRRSTDKSGRDLLSGLEPDNAKHDTVEDLTGLMMEFSSTHGTALYARLRKAVKASPNIRRLRGSSAGCGTRFHHGWRPYRRQTGDHRRSSCRLGDRWAAGPV